ncbi:phosphoribosyl-AMP cyclohydrolase [Terrihabitans soli]|uniref:Phosphoribosyl-AMP cyclohydrolase n=1 Tax=Terrihabitans soli TaxID=708113 RepID=A0A6S6QP83_9HYPH|nr:phosphoribosyl-AMP cyclohydrolase [Terrihabitans soli]BCJ91286.1 phosphoribosyl-AMP cyclohydrolase [Terrihabitans soli]
MSTPFPAPGSKADVEEGLVLAPRFDADGLVTCVVTDATSGDVLMVAHMNAEALSKTIATGEAHYYSRSRKKLWKKGEESGHVQTVTELRVDCDQDAILLKVQVAASGASCHTGRVSCFYRKASALGGNSGSATLEFVDAGRAFDPAKVYKS